MSSRASQFHSPTVVFKQEVPLHDQHVGKPPFLKSECTELLVESTTRARLAFVLTLTCPLSTSELY